MKALIVSPGIPHLYPAPHPAVAAAWDAGRRRRQRHRPLLPLVRHAGLGRASTALPQVVAITGSNGKSTTTALTAHVLAAAGRPVQVGGNIGRGVLDLDPAADGMVVVLELSSYQIELARALQPDIAVFLNLSPDHLDRHGGIGGYFAAKRRLFTQGGPSRSIIGIDENEGRFLANAMREEAGTGDPVITVSVTRKPARRRLAGPSPARASSPSGATAGRSPRSTSARWRRCPAPTTTRTPAPPTPRRAPSESRRGRSRRRSPAIPASPHRSAARRDLAGRADRQRLEGDERRRRREGAARASSASAGSPAGGRRRAASRRCARSSRASPRPT